MVPLPKTIQGLSRIDPSSYCCWHMLCNPSKEDILKVEAVVEGLLSLDVVGCLVLRRDQKQKYHAKYLLRLFLGTHE